VADNIFEFKCGQCGKMFATLEDLRDHELTAHPDRQVRREEEEEELEETPAA
jgi:predicted nucleic acid-binding Zn ribbon protein